MIYLGPELLNHVLALEVPDLDGGAGGGAQPVPGTMSLKPIHFLWPCKAIYLLGLKVRALMVSA